MVWGQDNEPPLPLPVPMRMIRLILFTFLFIGIGAQAQYEVVVPHQTIQDEATLIINFEELDTDSVLVHFPSGGTETNIRIFKEEDTEFSEAVKSVDFWIDSGHNYVVFYPYETGRYYVSYLSCSWGGHCYLVIE